MSIDSDFAEICGWLTKRGLQAVTRRGEPFRVSYKPKKYPLEVRDGKLKRKIVK